MNYDDFLALKRMVDPMTGLADVPPLPECLMPHQRDIVAWSLRRGRAAIFAGTGLGKTLMELTWAQEVARFTGKPVLVFAPLAVSAQHIREAEKFGIAARLVKTQADVGLGVNVTNYQKIEHFDIPVFGGIVLDESSILKSTDGHYRTRLIEHCRSVPFRLAATATPAPNDFMELGNHAEFLGVMSYTDMLATFFVHDGGDTQKWRLKGHAENEFWKWMASWAVMLRKPDDLGYPNDGYDLPQLRQRQHIVAVEYAPSMDTGLLFPVEARTMQERIAARRDTMAERVGMAFSIVIGSYWAKLSECLGNQNTKLTDAQKLSAIQNMLPGSRRLAVERQRKTANTCEPITGPISTNGTSERLSSRPNTTSAVARNTPPITNIESASNQTLESERQSSDASSCFEENTGSRLPSTTICSTDRAGAVPYAIEATAADDSTLTTATIPELSGGCFAPHATQASDNSKTTQIDYPEPSNTSEKLDRWVIWCQLNSEQDALEKAFGALALSVRGSKSDEENERAILAFLDGERPILLGKPSMLGFGLNLQCCHQTIFVGLNDSFEQVFQAIRRFWRFGQTKPVNVHFIAAETEGAVVANLRRKEADAERMAAAMVSHMADLSSVAVRGAVRDRPDYNPAQAVIIPAFLEAHHASA